MTAVLTPVRAGEEYGFQIGKQGSGQAEQEQRSEHGNRNYQPCSIPELGNQYGQHCGNSNEEKETQQLSRVQPVDVLTIGGIT